VTLETNQNDVEGESIMEIVKMPAYMAGIGSWSRDIDEVSKAIGSACNSAAKSTSIDVAPARRMPVKIVGNAAGKNTF